MDDQQELKLYYSKNQSQAFLIIYGILFVVLIPILIPLLKNLNANFQDIFSISYNIYLFTFEFQLVILVSVSLLYNASYKYLNKNPQIIINREGIKLKDNPVIPWGSIDTVTIVSTSRKIYFYGPMYTGNVLCVITKDTSKKYSDFLDELDNYNGIGKVVSSYEKKFNDSAAILYGEPLMEKQKEIDKDMNSFFTSSYKLLAIIIGPLVLILFVIYAYLIYNLK